MHGGMERLALFNTIKPATLGQMVDRKDAIASDSMKASGLVLSSISQSTVMGAECEAEG